MAFQFSNEGVPYHPPVAPEVPVAPREPQGERLGGTLINAWVHAALGREQAKLEQERLYQNADIAAKQLNFQQDKLGQEYSLRSRALGIEETMRDRGMDVQEALLPARKAELEAHANYFQNAVLGHTAANQSRAEMLGQFAKDAAKLDDAKEWVNNPFGQVVNTRALTNQYAGSTDSGVKATIQSYQDKAKESKVYLPKVNNEAPYFPADQVLEDLVKNGADSVFIPGLIDQGYIKETKDKGKFITGYKVLPKGKGLIGVMPEFKKADEAQSKLIPGSGKQLKDMSDPNIPTAADTRPALDLGEQSPPGGPLPKPDMSSVEREAEWVKQQADPKYKAKFLERHPDAAYLIQ